MSAYYLSRPGLVSALGSGIEETAAGLFAGSSAGLCLEDGWLADAPARIGRVRSELPTLPAGTEIAGHSHNHRLALAALAQIADLVEAAIARYGRHRVGVVVGTSTSGIAEGEAAVAAHVATGSLPGNFAYGQMEIGAPAPLLARHLGLCGPAYTVSTACSSGAKALASARLLLKFGVCDAVIAGGVDSLCRLTVNGFTALESTSSDVCNPLSKNRCGINIGEAAALFLVSREPGPVMLAGVGESSDAHHMSAPHPEGRGAAAAMHAALVDAGLNAGDIGYINLHATATPKNDEMESLAVSRVFPASVAVSGTKPMTGHTLGAAGAIEAAFCWLSLVDGRLPPHLWDGEADPELPPLQVVQPGQSFAPGRRACLSNSFAFGGNNISLLLAATD